MRAGARDYLDFSYAERVARAPSQEIIFERLSSPWCANLVGFDLETETRLLRRVPEFLSDRHPSVSEWQC